MRVGIVIMASALLITGSAKAVECLSNTGSCDQQQAGTVDANGMPPVYRASVNGNHLLDSTTVKPQGSAYNQPTHTKIADNLTGIPNYCAPGSALRATGPQMFVCEVLQKGDTGPQGPVGPAGPQGPMGN